MDEVTMNDITMTVVGNVVREVELRFTSSGDPVASFRVASSTRRFDRGNDRWVDGDTHYFTVTCWRSMAHNVVQSITKGMPVVVTGRLRSREVERACGDLKHVVRYHDIEALAVGPDLARGTATFLRVKRDAVVESEARSLADAAGAEAELEAELEAEVAAGLGLDGVVDLETGEIKGINADIAA
ncbi:MAG: single-stranded DNA-binding protein [Actinomycetes bacterium]